MLHSYDNNLCFSPGWSKTESMKGHIMVWGKNLRPQFLILA